MRPDKLPTSFQIDLLKTEWFDFFDIKIRHFLEEMGFIETFQLQQYFKAVFAYKNLSPTITFQELYEKTIRVKNSTDNIL